MLRTSRKAGILPPRLLRAFHNMADELRARTSYELTETLRYREQRESAQFGRLGVKWERRFTSPGDADLKPRSKR